MLSDPTATDGGAGRRHSSQRTLWHRPVALAALMLNGAAASVQAQTITTVPVSAPPAAAAMPVPVDGIWMLLALTSMLLVMGVWLIRSGRGKLLARSMYVLTASVCVAGLAGYNPPLSATQLLTLLTFTQSAGETLNIPVQATPANGVPTAFTPVQFTNASGTKLKISGIAGPAGLASCFPTGVPETLPATPIPSGATACAPNLELDKAAQCTVDVSALCAQAVADAKLPTLAMQPAAGALPAATVGTSYSQTVTVTGGTTSTYAISAGALPAGLAIDSATGVISGTPKADGSASFTVTATDASKATISRAYTLLISAPVISVPSPTSGSANVGDLFIQIFSASGGTVPYQFTVNGNLPAGLAMSAAGALSGAPTEFGVFTFTVTAKDSSVGGSAPYSGTSASITLEIKPKIAVSLDQPATVSDGTVGTVYSQTFKAAGGKGPYSFSVSNGSLPAGLTISSTGVLSGMPSTAGDFTFSLMAKDSSTGGTAPYVGVSSSYTVKINPLVSSPLSILTNSLLDGTVNSSYTQVVVAFGGQPPYSFSMLSGSLPAGLLMSTADGKISGTPTVAGTSPFQVQVTDSSTPPKTATANLSLTIAALAAPFSIATTDSTSLYSQVNASIAFKVSNGNGLYNLAISGSIPPGLTFSPSPQGGVLSGVPTYGSAGAYTVTVTVTELGGLPGSAPRTASTTVTIHVNDC